MPKIRRKYYQRAQEITNLVINNIVESKNVMPLLRSSPSILNKNNVENNNELSYVDCDDSQHISNDYDLGGRYE